MALFPHRFDYIYAAHPELRQSPDWRSESRHPLSDRIIQQGSSLFGVRFGAKTNYCLVDIDRQSIYHPSQDPLAIGRIAAALEPLGLVNHLTCTSSYSGGLHLYFPFNTAQSSWELAIAAAALLETAGLKLSGGQLELFPDPKPYRVEGAVSLFNAHRLPMQTGSYLVDVDFQPVWSSQERFVEQWQVVSAQNTLDALALKRSIKQAKRRCYQVSGKADKFINDLNAEIEPGWTGAGQTNYLLGRITMRAYIFDHVLTGEAPLEGKALVEKIIDTAKSLPGYNLWCRHQHEIEHRASEWASCIENSHYFHYGDLKGRYKNKLNPSELEPALSGLPSWNQQQSESARERIKAAVSSLLGKNEFPIQTTARFRALVQAGVGGGSLYRHRDLWHPSHFKADQADQQAVQQLDYPANNQTSLLHSAGGDNLPAQDFSDLTSNSEPADGNNFGRLAVEPISELAISVPARIKFPQSRLEALQQMHLERQRYFASGDSILIAEAAACSVVRPPPIQDD